MKCDIVRHSDRGPQNEELSTRYFYTEPKSKCIVHLSGLHGVEGHLGLQIQNQILQRDFSQSPVQIVVVQLVNPFGFAWNRRANRQNVDLNRNALSPHQIENPYFHLFKPFLDRGGIHRFLKLLPTVFKLGLKNTVQTVACGQTDFPESIFFAGQELQFELKSLEDNLRRIIAPGTDVHVIDVHTGLGTFGQETLILSGFDCDQDEKIFSKAFQKQLLYPGKTQKSYRADGSVSLLLKKIWGPTKLSYVCQEFGTSSALQVLEALIFENYFFQNRLHLSAEEQERVFAQSSRKMLHSFFPNDSKWRKSCVELGLLRFEQLVQTLSEKRF